MQGAPLILNIETLPELTCMLTVTVFEINDAFVRHVQEKFIQTLAYEGKTRTEKRAPQ